MENEQMMDEEQYEEQEEVLEVPEAPIEVNEHNNMSDGFDMDFGLGNIAPKNNNSDGFAMGLDLGLDF